MNQLDELYKEGFRHLKDGNFEKAKEIGLEILNMDFQDAHNLIASACFHSGEYEHAAKHYLYHFSFAEGNPNVFVAIAICYARMKNYPLAFRYIMEGCDYGSEASAYMAFQLYRLGRCNILRKIFNILKYGWKSRKLGPKDRKTYKKLIKENWVD